MAPPGPARLYAALAGAVLFVLGILGFFQDLSWLNFLHLGSGALALLLAAAAPRLCALALGLLYTVLSAWGLPEAVGWLHLGIGVLGLAAVAASSEPRAQAAGKGL